MGGLMHDVLTAFQSTDLILASIVTPIIDKLST
jgi:hypothetical protein